MGVLLEARTLTPDLQLFAVLWLPQWVQDSMLALVISSANSRTVQTRLILEPHSTMLKSQTQ